MTKYQFGSLFAGGLIEKSFETEDEAFEYAEKMTDGPGRVPIWKVDGSKRYAWYQQGWYDGEWVEVVEKEA